MNERADRKLPPGFSELEPFVDDWALPTEPERYDKRERSSMEDIQRFYDVTLPLTEQALSYLDQFALDALPDEARRLTYLMHSLATISFCVEVWKQPRVLESGAARLNSSGEPVSV